MCEGLQREQIINKIQDTFDVMDASSLPSVLTSSLVVRGGRGDPSRSTVKVSGAAIKVVVVKVLQLSSPLHTISLLTEP